MKRTNFIFLLIILLFFINACKCNKEEIVSKKEAITILKESSISSNVEVITTTETIVDGIKSSSTQKEVYYNDKYYHSNSSDYLTTQTWYGKINDSLYAFYYTKNANNNELKTSSKIELSLLESTKNQLNSIIKNLFDEKGNLLNKYNINGRKKAHTYTIKINNTSDIEMCQYTIKIKDNKVFKIVKRSAILHDSITITHLYNYNVTDFNLPTLNEYPLMVNG